MSKVTTGKKVFWHRLGTVEASGHAFTEAEALAALENRVASALSDDSGMEGSERLLGGLATTQFASDALRDALTATNDALDWQVGEALAEAYLEDYHDCEFPWPMSRDARNPRGSLPGTDSVGFQKHGVSHRMAFGETKTSTDKNSPPGVWKGRSGLSKQLEGLRDSTEIKGHIVVRYLGVRATGAAWQATYQAAAGRYLSNTNDVALFGVLVRDTSPNENDALARAKTLSNGCPKETDIRIVVLYLPDGHIPKLPEQVAKIQRRRKK